MNNKAIVEHMADFLFMVITGVVFFLVMGVLLTRGVGKDNSTALSTVATTSAMETLLYSYRSNFEQGEEVDVQELQQWLQQGGRASWEEDLPPAAGKWQ